MVHVHNAVRPEHRSERLSCEPPSAPPSAPRKVSTRPPASAWLPLLGRCTNHPLQGKYQNHSLLNKYENCPLLGKHQNHPLLGKHAHTPAAANTAPREAVRARARAFKHPSTMGRSPTAPNIHKLDVVADFDQSWRLAAAPPESPCVSEPPPTPTQSS
jgi:hypothetical protein